MTATNELTADYSASESSVTGLGTPTEAQFNSEAAIVRSPSGEVRRRFFGQRRPFFVVVYEQSNGEEFEPLGNAADVTSVPPVSLNVPEPDPSIWRGVFTPPGPKQVLFSEKHEIRLSELPRWKPKITLNLDRLTREDDE